MNNSTTHTKDHIMTRTLSLLLAGLMMLGLFGTLPLYGCSGGDTTPVATPGKDALQNATPGSDDAGQPTAEITAEPTPIPETPTPETPIPETPTPECTDEPSPTPWHPDMTLAPTDSYYERYYDILRDRLHRKSTGLYPLDFDDTWNCPRLKLLHEDGELWGSDRYTGKKIWQYPEELYQYALDRLRVDEVSDCYGRENWIAFLHYGDYDEPPIDISNVACILVTDDDWNTWNEISFTPDHDANYYAEQAIIEDHGEDYTNHKELFQDWYIVSIIIQSVWVVSPQICHITIALSIDDLRPLGIYYPFVHFITTDGGEHWETIQYCLFLRAPYFEGEEGVAVDVFSEYYITHDGGRTWELDEELAHYYQQLRWRRVALAIDRFTRTDEMRENAIQP